MKRSSQHFNTASQNIEVTHGVTELENRATTTNRFAFLRLLLSSLLNSNDNLE